MPKGNYQIEYVVGLVLCLLVLIIAYLVMIGGIGPSANATKTEGGMQSDCLSWSRQGYSKESFAGNVKGYPNLWQTCGSNCLKEDETTKAKILEISAEDKCKADSATANDLDGIVKSAKDYCTWNQRS